MEYQLIALGPGANEHLDVLMASISSAATTLQLPDSVMFRALRNNQRAVIGWDGIPVAVWFGTHSSPSEADMDLLTTCLNENISVFPVVSCIDSFTDATPEVLHRVNGHQWGMPGLVESILRAYRLTRRQRKVFISYRRDDAAGVANQLFDELTHRGYWVFLDTVSVESGIDFQETLWARMADVDLLIFLDSPGALTSRWVHQELARAHNLTLGVLQIIWPGQARTSGTELCDFIELVDEDFIHGHPNKYSQLTHTKASGIVSKAEFARIASLGKKRIRIVSDIINQATSAGFTYALNPVGPIDLYRNGKLVGSVIPVLGIPDAPLIQERENELESASLSGYRAVYNGLGIDPEWSRHLHWLNAHHLLKTEQIDSISDWLASL